MRRAVVIAALQRAGLPRKVAAKISFAVRGEAVLYWEFETRESTKYFVEIVNGDLVFCHIKRGKRFGQPGLIGRLVDEGSDFVPSWDWRQEENWMRDGDGRAYSKAFYYPKWREPFFVTTGMIRIWSDEVFSAKPKGFREDFMGWLEREGRFAAYDRLGSTDLIITQPLCSEEFRQIQIDDTVAEDQALAAHADFETKLSIDLTKPLRAAADLAQSEEFYHQIVLLARAADEDENE